MLRVFCGTLCLGKTAYGGTYADGNGKTIVINPSSGRGDVVAESDGMRIVAECKGGIVNTRHAGQLSRLRQGKNLSQEELADRAGINRNYVGMLEREQHAATIDMLEKLAIVLEADPVEFFRRDT